MPGVPARIGDPMTVTRRPFSIKQCAHYNGSGLPCKKGVDPGMVRDHEDRTPCVEIRGITGKVNCDLRVMPEGPPRGELGPASQALAQVLSGLCVTCGQIIEGEMEFNGAVLALPCRHVRRSARDNE